MLTAFTLKNFKSYRDAHLPLAPLSILIGANASGKSNAIEALRLLSWLAEGQKLFNIQHVVQRSERIVRGRLATLGYHGSENFGFGCETDEEDWKRLDMTLTLREDELHITGESITSPNQTVPLYQLDGPSEGIGTDVRVAYNNFARGGKKPHILCSDQQPIFTQLDTPARYPDTQKTAARIIPETVRNYQSHLGNILFLDPVPARMRDYSFVSERRLLGDGSNLSSALFALWGEESQAGEEPYASNRGNILKFIQSLPEQDIQTVGFLFGPRKEVMLELVETFGGTNRRYDASLLSDGTLRVLAIAAAMLSATEGSLVVIEEIDNGVHPSRARLLLDQIQSIARRRSLRVLLSTHNPALLDALPDAAIPDVVFCYRDPEEGDSRLVRLQDVPDYPELIAQGTLGHLMTAGILEQFVKFHPGKEKRKRQALAWLESLEGQSHRPVHHQRMGTDPVSPRHEPGVDLVVGFGFGGIRFSGKRRLSKQGVPPTRQPGNCIGNRLERFPPPLPPVSTDWPGQTPTRLHFFGRNALIRSGFVVRYGPSIKSMQ